MIQRILFILWLNCFTSVSAQIRVTDTLPPLRDTSKHRLPLAPETDSSLRIINLNPYFTIHVDSVLYYDLRINKPLDNYYWFIKSGPVGVRIDRQTGLLYFKAEKSFFKSGKLKYDLPYRVDIGVQNLYFPSEHTDTSFTILFYSTEVIASRLKPTVSGTLFVEEGDSVRFRIQCETGTFPIEQITMISAVPISPSRQVRACNDEFSWWVPYDLIRDSDTTTQRRLQLQFIGTDKFMNKDTADVLLYVKPGINYPQKIAEHQKVADDMLRYIEDLKVTFYVISKNIKSTKTTRAVFDIGASSTALAGTILATTAENPNTQDIGKILPSVGLTLVPVKEAVAPNRVQEQNTASQVRAAIKRLEYMRQENALYGERDPEILAKTKKMRDELKQTQLQLVDLPIVEYDNKVSDEEAEKYFNDPKVNKKYKLKVH